MRLEIGQIISQIIAFLIMLWVLKRYAWNPLLKTLDERKEKIQTEVDDIKLEKDKINALREDYQNKLKELDAAAGKKIQEAVEQGKQLALQIQKDAHSQAREMIAKAQVDLQHEVAKAKVQLKDEIIKISMEATEKVLQTRLDGQKQESLITGFIDQVGSN